MPRVLSDDQLRTFLDAGMPTDIGNALTPEDVARVSELAGLSKPEPSALAKTAQEFADLPQTILNTSVPLGEAAQAFGPAAAAGAVTGPIGAGAVGAAQMVPGLLDPRSYLPWTEQAGQTGQAIVEAAKGFGRTLYGLATAPSTTYEQSPVNAIGTAAAVAAPAAIKARAALRSHFAGMEPAPEIPGLTRPPPAPEIAPTVPAEPVPTPTELAQARGIIEEVFPTAPTAAFPDPLPEANRILAARNETKRAMLREQFPTLPESMLPQPEVIRPTGIAPPAETPPPLTDVAGAVTMGGPEVALASGNSTGPISEALAAGFKQSALWSSAADNFERILNQASRVASTAMGTKPQFLQWASKAPEVFSGFIRKMAARDDARVGSIQLYRELQKILPSKDEQALFGKWLVSDQIKGLVAAGESPNMKLVMAPVDEAAVVANPKMQAAMKWWADRAMPEFERWKGDAKIEGERYGASGMYAKLVRYDRSHGGARVIGEQGAAPGPSSKMRARSAQKATGTADLYVVDPQVIIRETLMDRVRAARHNQFNDLVKASEVPKDPATGKVPKSVMFAGKDTPVEYVEIRPHTVFVDKEAGTSFALSSRVPVPKPIADMYTWARNPKTSWDVPGLSGLNRLVTGLALASPAEAVMHSVNVLGGAYNVPGITGHGPVSWAANTVPIFRIADVVGRAFDLSGPDALADYRNGATYGALRASSFEGAHTGLQRAPVFKQLYEGVFGLPKGSKGLGGFETRVRVVAKRAIQAADPALTDAEAWQTVNNHFGTYVRGLEPTLVHSLRQIPIIGDPFAAAGVALGKSGVKGVAGIGPRGFSPEVAFANWVSPAITTMVANKVINDAWPWETKKLPGLAPGAIRVYKDDKKTVDIPFRLLAPATARGLNYSGLGKVLTGIRDGERDPFDLFGLMVDGGIEAVRNRVGPLGRAAVIYYSGKDVSGRQVADVSATNPHVKRLKAALASINTAPETLVGTGPQADMESPAARVTMTALKQVGLAPVVKSPESALLGAPIRQQFASWREAALDISQKAYTVGQQEGVDARDAYIHRRIAADLPGDMEAQRLAWLTVKSYLRGHAKSLERTKAHALAR